MTSLRDRLHRRIFGAHKDPQRHSDDEVIAFYHYHRERRGENDPETQMWRKLAERVEERRRATGKDSNDDAT